MIGRILLVLAMLAVWLIVLMPLKAVAIAAGGAAQLGYDDVFGTVWNGRVYGLRIGGERVRETAVSVSPLALLTGRVAADWRVADSGLSGDGHAIVAPGRVQLENVSLTVPLGRLAETGRTGPDPRAPVFVRIAQLGLTDGRCESATGSARSDALAALAAPYNIDAPALDGMLACDGDDLELVFSGESADMTVEGSARLRPEGYDWQVSVDTVRPELAEALALGGFEAEGERWQAQGRGVYGANR